VINSLLRAKINMITFLMREEFDEYTQPRLNLKDIFPSFVRSAELRLPTKNNGNQSYSFIIKL